MLKRHHQFFVFVQVALDLCMLCLAWKLSSNIYLENFISETPKLAIGISQGDFHGLLGTQLFIPPPESAVTTAEQGLLRLLGPLHLFSMGLIVWLAYVGKLYNSYREQVGWKDAWILFRCMLVFALVGVGISTTASVVENIPAISWIFFLVFSTCALGIMSVFRVWERLTLSFFRSRGYNLRHVLVIGAGRNAQDLVRRIQTSRWMGYRIKGYLDDDPSIQGRHILGIPVIGRLKDLPLVLESKGVDQVYCALPFNQMEKTLFVADQLTRTTVDFRVVPDLVSLTALNSTMMDIDGLPVLGVRESPLNGVGALYKRLFDIVFSLTFIVVFSWLYVLIALLVKLSSAGPVFYRQNRVGYDGEVFRIIKYRSMRTDAEANCGAKWAEKGDSRTTSLGKFLRRYSLDEIPQFFNVLAGTMSVVGPRPERPEFIGSFTEEIPRYMLRHKTKAGVTGWAQVNGWRGQTSLTKRIQYDLYYIEHWSVWLDIRIILMTPFRALLETNAY